MVRFEIAIDDAQRHALATALNYMLMSVPSLDPEMAERMEELAGMLQQTSLDPGALNDFTA